MAIEQIQHEYKCHCQEFQQRITPSIVKRRIHMKTGTWQEDPRYGTQIKLIFQHILKQLSILSSIFLSGIILKLSPWVLEKLTETLELFHKNPLS